MAMNSQANRNDASVRSYEDALWICHSPLLPCFDSETRGTWRLVDKRACEAVLATTQSLTWNSDSKSARDESGQDITIFSQCPKLRRVCILGAAWGLALHGLPHTLQALEVHFRRGPATKTACQVLAMAANNGEAATTLSIMPIMEQQALQVQAVLEAASQQLVVPGVEGRTDHRMSATLSPLTALTQLEEASLHGFPDTSLAALEFCTALRSLDLEYWPALTDISSLSQLSNLHTLSLSECAELEDITAFLF
eukprot:gene23799-biopygen18305